MTTLLLGLVGAGVVAFLISGGLLYVLDGIAEAAGWLIDRVDRMVHRP